ncbi:MAG: hypothetical protein K6G58_08710 [Lachnospiraceae bacterium]|nr:hypothetical protein [Lachnospiraceae bacterium]
MLTSDELIAKYGKSKKARSSGETERANKAICETLYNSFHASPTYARSVFLAFYGPDSAPDIRDFAEDMTIHSDRVFFPVMAGNTMVFFEQGTDAAFDKNSHGIYEPSDITDPLEGSEDAVLFIPYEIFSGKGDPKVIECYKNFIASCKGLQRIHGIAFDSQIGAGDYKYSPAIIPEAITTESGTARL